MKHERARMYLRKLEIFGFKSFADKTTLQFEEGITAIVGPNGCGKSNIFDAIRWVLGEQGVKDLRAIAMEDVIFNGTDKKPALGFSEVSLTFSNELKILPLDYNEVTITRRLFRSGESEYLLNRTGVRLKDIVELFMGTGIGAEAYSLVQQGQVDLLVSAYPEDRRILLDEASGITKYKCRKKEALNKLKETEDNLLRLNDIILEVKRQIASLERQATKARRYKEEFDQLRDLEIRLAQNQIQEFQRHKDQIQQLIEEVKSRESKLTQDMEELKAVVAYEGDHLNEAEEKINSLHTEGLKLDTSLEMNSRQIHFHQERLENFLKEEAHLKEQHFQLKDRSYEKQQKVEEIKQTLEHLNETIEANLKKLAQGKEDLKSITDTVAQDQIAIQREEEKLLSLTAHQVKFKNELTAVMKEHQTCLARQGHLDRETTKITEEKAQSDHRVRDLEGELNTTLKKLEGFKTDREQQKQSLEIMKRNLLSFNQQEDEAEKNRLFLISQKAFIEKLGLQYPQMPDPVVEGHFLSRLVPSPSQRGIIGKVKDVVADGQFYKVLCELKFIESNPEDFSPKINDLDRHLESLKAQSQDLILVMSEKENEFEGLTQAVHLEEKKMSMLEVQKNDLWENSSKISMELQVILAEIGELREFLGRLNAKENEISQKLDAITNEMQSCQEQIHQRQRDVSVQSKIREETTIFIAQLEAEIKFCKEKEKTHIEHHKILSDALGGDLKEIKRLEDENHQMTCKKQRIDEEVAEMTRQIEILKSQKESLKEIHQDYEKKKNDLSQRINSLQSQIRSLEKEGEDFKNSLHQYEMKIQEIAFGQKTIKDRLWQVYKVDWEGLSGGALSLGQEEEGQSFLVHKEELPVEIDRLKKKCESYGAVNLVAIEEFDQLKERFQFLTKQQSDLLTAKESLHQTIGKINRTAKEMFMETFTKVNEEFRSYFRLLFGGGESQLVLLDPENELESGIEIIARPPGKKLQNIGLLSGGEKTLTAIALIFGVLKVHPSPFCVLDEIDASLDESNVGRFGYLLKDFAKTTQFIIITHNKKTIAQADVMYGITMQESGVSKIVSVKFVDEKKALAQELEVETV